MKTPTRCLAIAALFALPALADDAGLLRCRAIAESTARLACYDALAAGVGKSAPAAAPAAAATPRSPAPTQAKAAPTLPATTPETFGLQAKPAANEVTAIESYIPGRFEGWKGNRSLTLANGQVWQVADDSRVFMDKVDPKVKISRGMLGVFYLEIEGRSGSTRVRRVQ